MLSSASDLTEPWIVVGRDGDEVVFAGIHPAGHEGSRRVVAARRFVEELHRLESLRAPRWVWSSSAEWYPELLAAGVRVQRCHDLLLCRLILEASDVTGEGLKPSPLWRRAESGDEDVTAPTLLDMLPPEAAAVPLHRDDIDESIREFAAQRECLLAQPDGRLSLLCAAESAGGLVAEELRSAGIPWSAETHVAILDERLGAWPATHRLPRALEDAADEVRRVLGDDDLRVESPPALLRALRRAGLSVTSTSKWELADVDHPVVAPLLRFKSLLRLHTANGRAWLREWVHEGRFRPVYIVGGVVTGRWTSSGGGVLQIPRMLRPAVRADDGWILVCADVAQLEPRVLAAMAGDRAMADAARGRDLYEGIVRRGAVADRQSAKYAVLGAMYGATTGESGRLVPRLRDAFPLAMGLVDKAAKTGEDGGVVATHLGRRSPRPDDAWRAVQRRASEADAEEGEVLAARRRARDRGRFTRNFVVQGSAAEWALVWLAEIRRRLSDLPESAVLAAASGRAFERRAHLAFFLHDEVIVHAPEEQAEEVVEIVHEAARTAARTLFGGFPVDFPLDVRVARDAGKD